MSLLAGGGIGAVGSVDGVRLIYRWAPGTEEEEGGYPGAQETARALFQCGLSREQVEEIYGDPVEMTNYRDEAFTVCRAVIETIKLELPVWKRQHAADGSAQWQGLGG